VMMDNVNNEVGATQPTHHHHADLYLFNIL